MNVLITDGENRSALAATRSLGRCGYRVIVSANRIPCLSSVSRFCARGVQAPDPMGACSQYIETVQRIVDSENIDLMVPMTEQSIYLINRARTVLPHTLCIACADQEAMDAVSDKSRLIRLAEALNIPTPRTIHLADADALDRHIEFIDRYPVVVKPSHSKIITNNGIVSGTVRYAANPKELRGLYASDRALRYPSMIQELITGPGTGLFTLFDKDRHRVLFSHRRILEKPPAGGVSVVSESVALDPEMVEAARRLLSSVGWQGVAMVEFKRDINDGKAKLMEINGRFWGTLQLAFACGVDFPKLLIDYVQGKQLPAKTIEYVVGHRLQWVLGSLDHLLIRLKSVKGTAGPMDAGHSLWGAVAELLPIGAQNTSMDVVDRNDIRPWIHELRNYLKRGASAALPKFLARPI